MLKDADLQTTQNRRSASSLKWKRAHKKEAAATTEAWRLKNVATWKLTVLAHYGPDGQLRCAWPECAVVDPDMLALDHIADDGAAERKHGCNGGWSLYYRLYRQKFPEGYQTLCHNHNWKKELMRRREERIS